MAERTRGAQVRGLFPRILAPASGAPEGASRIGVLLSRESLLRFALSVVLAVALWLYVTSKSNPQSAVFLQQPIPILTANTPPGLIVTNTLPSAHVRFRTTTGDIQVNASNFRVFADLLRMKAGVHNHVRVVCQSDPGIQCVAVSPSTVSVVIDREQQKEISVHPRIVGQIPRGYYTNSIQIFPNTVNVSGPQTLDSQVARATVTLNLSGATSSIDGTYRVQLGTAEGHAVAGAARLILEPSQVRVHVTIRALSSFKPLPVLVSLKGQPKSGFGVTGVTVTPPEVTVQGSTQHLRKVTSVTTQPVNLKGRSKNFSTRVPLLLPHGITSTQRYATLHVKVQPVDAYASIEVGVSLKGVLPGLSAHVVPARVLVTVVGPATAIRDVARKMHGVVDMTGYGIGTYSLAPRMTSPSGFHVANIYPAKVTVVLTPPAT
jgi:YbbR domain-containing protein